MKISVCWKFWIVCQVLDFCSQHDPNALWCSIIKISRVACWSLAFQKGKFQNTFLVTSKIRERVARAQLFLLGSFKFILCADCLGEIFSSPKTSKSILSAHYLKFAIAHLKKAFHFCTSQQLAGLLCGRNSNYNTPEWPKLCKVRMWKKEAINVIISSLVDTDMHSCSPKGMLTIWSFRRTENLTWKSSHKIILKLSYEE